MAALSVAILTTVHNNRVRVLDFLQECFRQIDRMRDDGAYEFTVYVVDDGSVDGTSDDIRKLFPQVHLVQGDGSLYRNQGLRLAWDTAAAEADYDFYLWADAMIRLQEAALTTLTENSFYLRHRAIVVGTIQELPLTGEAFSDGDVPAKSDGASAKAAVLFAGGRTKSGKVVMPEKMIPVPCHTFDGELVLVPRFVHKVLGNLDAAYHHRYGDWDYGIRAYREGITRAVAPGILGIHTGGESLPDWRNPKFTLRERYIAFLGPKGCPPREQFSYDCRSMGFLKAIGHMVSLNLKVIFARSPKKA